jgi:hypothetical protein
MNGLGGSEHANDRATFKTYGRVPDKLNLSINERCGMLGVDRLTYDRWQINSATATAIPAPQPRPEWRDGIEIVLAKSAVNLARGESDARSETRCRSNSL